MPVWRGGTKSKVDWQKIDLRRLYLDEGLSAREIGNRIGVSNVVVLLRLRQQNIKPRSSRESRLLRGSIKVDWDQMDLEGLYYDMELSINEIAKRFGVSYRAAYYAMKVRGIKFRSSEEGRALFDYKNPNYYIGKNNPAFVGRRKHCGYIQIYQPDHPRSDKTGYVFEQIIIWEQANQKSLPNGWLVHHLNGIKTDNRISNLQAMPFKKHRLLIPILQKRIQGLEAQLNYQGQLL